MHYCYCCCRILKTFSIKWNLINRKYSVYKLHIFTHFPSMTLSLKSYRRWGTCKYLLMHLCVCIYSVEKPLPQIATGDVISVIALLLAAGVLMGITITVLVLKIRSRKDDSSYANNPLFLHCRNTLCILYNNPHYPIFFFFFLLVFDQKWLSLQKTVPANKEKTRRWYPGNLQVVFVIYKSHIQNKNCFGRFCKICSDYSFEPKNTVCRADFSSSVNLIWSPVKHQ